MEENISIPADVNVSGQPITFTVASENTNVAAQNCWQPFYPSYPYGSMPNNYYVNYGATANVTYLHLTEEQLRKIVQEEVSKAIEGLGKRVLRRASIRKTE